MIDQTNRKIDYMRISVTDRCNFRCSYCMPEQGITGMPHNEILTFEEIIKIVKSGVDLGISKIKLTGGEPFVRKSFTNLVKAIGEVEGIEAISLTTNGLLLGEHLDELAEAGLTDVNISLDTLDPEKFKTITHVDGLEKVLESIHKATQSQLKSVKINVVPIREFNEDEIVALAALAKDQRIYVRFIELMPMGLGSEKLGLSQLEVFQKLENAFGPMEPYSQKVGNGPAKYWGLEEFKGKIGFISAVSDCFCDDCNRVRVSSDGYLKLCLHSKKGIDLKNLIRNGCSQGDLTKVMKEAIIRKPIRHQFGEEDAAEREDKIMAQIGG